MKFEDQHIKELFDAQPQAVLWFRPVCGDEPERPIIDFEYGYCNKEAINYTGFTKEQIIGLLVKSSPLLDEASRISVFEELLEVFQTGKQVDNHYYNAVLRKHVKVLRRRIQEGVLSIIQDRTEEYKLIEQLKEKTGQLEEEKAFSNSVLDASLNVIFTCKAVYDTVGNIIDFRYLQINRAFSKMFNLSAEQVVGKTMTAIFQSTKEQGVLDLYRQVLQTGEPLQGEHFYSGDGIQSWYHYVIVKKGEDEVVTTFADITPQKQTELEKDRQKTLLNNILKHSPTGISVTEIIRDEEGAIIDGRTIIANEAAAEFIGIPFEVYLGKTIKEVDPNILNSPLYQKSIATLQTGKPFHTQYYFEATRKWLELSVSKMDEDHLINVFMDVTSTKETQLQLEKSLEELKRTNSNLEQFTYAASHDLKEPIRKIRTFSDRLKIGLGSRLNEKEQLWLNRLEVAADRMKLLVDDLLAYSYVNLSKDATETIDLNEKLGLVLGDLELLIEEKGARITAGHLPKIKGFRRQLQQLFQNLICNALKYSKPGVTPEIRIDCRTVYGRDTDLNLSSDELNQQYYLIELSDNGIGFAQKDAERIFNVFQRLHVNTEYKGTGVGLSIARKVAENHKGFLLAKGEPGKGATFQIFLPVEESLPKGLEQLI